MTSFSDGSLFARGTLLTRRLRFAALSVQPFEKKA